MIVIGKTINQKSPILIAMSSTKKKENAINERSSESIGFPFNSFLKYISKAINAAMPNMILNTMLTVTILILPSILNNKIVYSSCHSYVHNLTFIGISSITWFMQIPITIQNHIVKF